MFWRKFKLDWSYAMGELAIVTVGVLIALGINEWNNERLERAEEVDVIIQIIADIELDLHGFEFRLKAIEAKEDSLLRVRAVLSNGTPHDPKAFLRDIIVGADFGWNQGLAQRATFDDLLGSGRLRVISNREIRTGIANYYRHYEDEHIRIEERETAYPGLSYQLVPRGYSWNEDGVVWERDVEAGLSDEQLDELVKAVHESSIRNHVTAEINLARFIRGITTDVQGQATSLVVRLEKYQTEID